MGGKILTDYERTWIRERRWEGASYREIGAEFGIAPSTARSVYLEDPAPMMRPHAARKELIAIFWQLVNRGAVQMDKLTAKKVAQLYHLIESKGYLDRPS
jgi:hypothetical protein